MGKIIASCQHEIDDFADGVHLAFRDFVVDRGDMETGGGIGTVYGFYCKKCAEEYKQELDAWELPII